jgi:hemolysin activation/secretion protein
VVLNLARRDQVLGEINLNNHVTEYTGPYQAQGNLGLEGLLGRGEIFSLDGAYSGNVDWYGSRRLSGNGSVPLSPGGLNWVGSYSWSDYRLLQDLSADHYRGSFAAGTIGLSQVLWRRPKANLSVRLIGEVDLFDDYVKGVQYSDRTNWIGRLTFNGDRQDKLFGGTGINNAILTLSVGNLSRNADGENELDEATMGSAGTWGKINLIASRYQSFKQSRWSLELFGQAQGAFHNLDSAEKMSLGWPNGVRAYPPGEAAGDSGIAGQFTARYQIAKNVVLKGFVDGGYIWKWTNWFDGAQDPGSLGIWGPGIGVDWGTRGDVLLSVDLAFPMGENTYRADLLDSDGNNPDARVWVSLRKWL